MYLCRKPIRKLTVQDCKADKIRDFANALSACALLSSHLVQVSRCLECLQSHEFRHDQ